MDISEIKTRLADDAESVARLLLPNGRKHGNEWRAGDTSGSAGDSLGVHLTGAKAGVWSDFATGEGGDLLDLYRASKGGNLVDALTWAKDWLGVVEPTFEPRRPKQYRKPQRHPECRIPKSAVLDYLHSRGLTDATISALKIGEIAAMEFDYAGGVVKSPAVVFPFITDGELLFVKYLGVTRPNGDKLTRVEAKCEPILFGWQAIPDNAREVVICEGEFNAASWLQLGVPALSTPFGAGKGGKHNWIESEWDRLARFETIYLDFDPDAPGREAVADLVPRLGRHRCRVVPAKPGGLKDTNDWLKAGATNEQARALLDASASCDPSELRRASDFTDDVLDQFFPSSDKIRGIEMPFAAMRGKFHLRPGETTIWTGFSKHGKTMLLNHVHAMIAAKGERVCIASFEMRAPVLLKRMVRQVTAKREPSEAYIRQVMEWTYDRIWLFDHVGSANKDRILEVFEYAFRRYRISYFIVDSLMKCGIAVDDYAGQDAFVEAITNFANLNNVHVSLVAHTRKDDDEDKPPAGQDIKGSGGMKDRVHNVVVVWRNKPKERAIESLAQKAVEEKDVEDELEEPDALMIVDCQREGDGDTPAQPLWFDKDSQTYRDDKDSPLEALVPFKMPSRDDDNDDYEIPEF
jgi:twinkle protein